MQFDPEKITFFAKTDARGQQVPFGIRAKDRQRHMYVVGKTGMGKSTLLENMAVQDIQNGEGMAFIDPHGSAAETLLDYIPEHRVNDVVYFAPFDLENPISFNVMEDVGVEKRHLVVSGLMSTFKKIWVDAWSARMEYILTNALLVLIEYPDTTLLSVNRLFNDKAYRLKVVDYCTDPAVKSFWVDEFANYTERFAAEALPAIQNKIGQFTGNPLIRNIIGQPHSSFDFREMMDQKKIVIMNLSKGLIGETNANLLGSMLTTRIYLAAMSRANLPVAEMKQMPNFYFYVDEFQSFANATFANILSEARKYHLNLIIAHQYIEQMEEEVRDAVFGNVGTTIAFRVGPFDAETLETVFTPRFLAADLVNLGFAQIYLTLMIDGIGSQPFSAVTLPPISPPRSSCKNMVIAASRRNYTSDRLTVEALVAELHTPTPPPPPKPDKKSGGGNNQNSGTPYVPKSAAGKPAGSTTVSTNAPTYEKKTLTETNQSGTTTSVNVVMENRRSVTVTQTQGNRPESNRQPREYTPTPSAVVLQTPTPTPTPAPAPSPVATVAPVEAPSQATVVPSTPAPAAPAAEATQSTARRSDRPDQSGRTDRPTQNQRGSNNDRDTSSRNKDRTPYRGGNDASKKSPLHMAASTPRQKSATTDDLRNILAKISQEAAAPITPPKPQTAKNNAPAAISPLQAALGALTAVSNDQTARELPPRPNRVEGAVVQPSPTHHRQTPKFAPDQALARPAQVAPRPTEHSQPVSPQQTQSAAAAPQPAPANQPTATTAQTTPAQPLPPTASAASSQKDTTSPLDAKNIVRLLKTPAHEKSPLH